MNPELVCPRPAASTDQGHLRKHSPWPFGVLQHWDLEVAKWSLGGGHILYGRAYVDPTVPVVLQLADTFLGVANGRN